MELKLFFAIHQDSSDPQVAKYPSQLLSAWMEERTECIRRRVARKVTGDIREIDFIFVNIWLLKEAVLPGNVRYSKKYKQISVEVGVNAIELEVPANEKDFERVLQSGELALKHALGKYGMELGDEKMSH